MKLQMILTITIDRQKNKIFRLSALKFCKPLYVQDVPSILSKHYCLPSPWPQIDRTILMGHSVYGVHNKLSLWIWYSMIMAFNIDKFDRKEWKTVSASKFFENLIENQFDITLLLSRPKWPKDEPLLLKVFLGHK